MLKQATKIISLAVLLLMLAITSFAQNTKGDKPESNNRESRFRKSDKKQKTVKRKEDKRKTSNLRAYKPRKNRKRGEFAGKSARPINNQSASGKNKKIYSQNGPFVNNPSKVPRDNQRAVSNRSTLARASSAQSADRSPGRKARVKPRSTSRSYIARQSINIVARFPRPKRKVEKAYTRDISGRRLRTKNFETKRPEIIQVKGGKQYSRTAKDRSTRSKSIQGGSFRNFTSVKSKTSSTNRKILPRSVTGSIRKFYAQFVTNPGTLPRNNQRAESNKGELAHVKRLQTPVKRPGRKTTIIPRSASSAFIKKRSTNVWAQFPRKKKKGERAVLTDIAGKPLRTKNFETKRPELITPTFKPYFGRKRVGDRAYRGPATGGYSTASKSGQRAWTGDITRRKIRGIKIPRKDTPSRIMPNGYKSASQSGEKRPGKSALPVKPPGIGGEILRNATGKVHGRRPLKGGGSVSGQVWNNRNRAIIIKTPPKSALKINGYTGRIKRSDGFSDQGESYTGSIKARRPLKGGGSVSGKLWNNNSTAIQVRTPPASAMKINGYPGKMKRFEGQPGFSDQGEEYTGSIKARRPQKGGGSVSGKLWNNNSTAIQVRTPGAGANKIGNFQGNIKTKRPEKGGGSVSGKLWNNKETAIAVRTPGKGAERIGNFQGNIKTKRPEKGGGSISGKLWNNDEKPILVKAPASGAERAGELQTKVKAYNYIRNPSSAESASKVREPGKAFARSTDFQGNIRMQKFRLFEKNRELHPDAKFVKTNKNNVDEERDTLTNFKLWWARLFKKEETQPDHLKEKGKKPRYDKGEDGLWYE